MEGLATLLLFAGLFYFMMRFGCGAHTVHGRGGGHGDHGRALREHGSQKSALALDPVCGMQVAPGEGYTKEHLGFAYRFCSRTCLDKFAANPDHYAHAHGGHQ